VEALVAAPAVALTRLKQRRQQRELVVRAALPEEEDAAEILQALDDDSAVVSVHADPKVEISALARCMESDAVGDSEGVAGALSVPELHDGGMDGSGVLLVMVDAGVNVSFLNARGRQHQLDRELSWMPPDGGHAPGEWPAHPHTSASHGTIAAFAAGICAPNCTIVDLPAFGDPQPPEPRAEAWLSDIERGLQRVHRYLSTTPNQERRVVISNSWALVDPEWDDPDLPMNYSDNPQHRFSQYLGELEQLGADIVFAAGNAGSPCNMHGDLMGEQPISGANSLQSVITVGAVAVDGERLGYSSSGPGRLAFEKPDICGFSHFAGSGLSHADWGTSVACPTVAGVIAAIRSKVSAEDLPPRDLAQLLRETASRSPGSGYDAHVGWGIIDPGAALTQLKL
jgi:hypothetical protein